MDGTLIGAGILVLLIVGGIYLNNGIISRMNAVERAWANVIGEERQKNKILPHLEKIAEEYKLHEEKVFVQVTELRTALGKLSSDRVDADSLMAAERQTASLLQGLNVVVENYPDLKASGTFNTLMREVAEQQENIGAAIRIFNQNVEAFNTGIEIFPNSLVNGWFAKKSRVKTFTDSEAEAGFEYKPNIS